MRSDVQRGGDLHPADTLEGDALDPADLRPAIQGEAGGIGIPVLRQVDDVDRHRGGGSHAQTLLLGPRSLAERGVRARRPEVGPSSPGADATLSIGDMIVDVSPARPAWPGG